MDNVPAKRLDNSRQPFVTTATGPENKSSGQRNPRNMCSSDAPITLRYRTVQYDWAYNEAVEDHGSERDLGTANALISIANSISALPNESTVLTLLNTTAVWQSLEIATKDDMSFNGPISEPYPTLDSAEMSTNTHIQGGFKISVRKLPISKSQPIEEMTKKLGIPPPEMIFGDNFVRLEHLESHWQLEFNAVDALDRVDKTDKTMLKVAYSREWSSSREKQHESIKEVVKPFDWSYSTDYKGTLGGGHKAFAPENDAIPTALLRRKDPILFFDEVILYESELDDNGISMLSCKLRVMKDRMLILCRLFMRLDNVLFRIRDTRVYVDFQTAKVTREYTALEEKFENVKEALIRAGNLPDEVTAAMRDPNQLAALLPKVEQTLESVTLV